MKTISICTAVLALAGLSTGAHAVIINIDATKDIAVEHTFDAGTYTFAVVGTTVSGASYNGWTYAVADTGFPATGVREAFTVSLDNAVYSIDKTGTTPKFTSYDTAADALSAFSTGDYTAYAGKTDGTPLYTNIPSLTYTFTKSTTLYFSVPDYKFDDNTGGVSLSVTSAVPETQGYAMALLGLGAVGLVARRRRDL